MTLTPNIIFDLDPENGNEAASKMDVVRFAVAPIDVLTGRIVSKNIRAFVSVEVDAGQLLNLPDKPIRNLSGMLVFVNMPENYTKFQVHLNAENSGYFDPEPMEFLPLIPSSDFDEEKNPRLDVPLFPRPGFSFDEFVTLISGVVIRDSDKVESAKVSLLIKPEPGPIFETRTDKLGAFVLPLNLTRDIDMEDEKIEVDFKIETRDANDQWQVEFEKTDIVIVPNERGVFTKPINLTVADPGHTELFYKQEESDDR